jgi:hypothetical protein
MIEPNINDAVRAIHTNAVTIWGDSLNELVVHDADGNTISIDPSAVTTQLATLQTQYAEQQQAQANAKASALAKLTALGLTQAEITALIGV